MLEETQRIYKDLPVGLCYRDTDLRYIQINDWLAEINGLPAEEHLGRTIGELIPDVAAKVEAQLQQVIDTGEPIIGGEVEAETPAQPGIKRHFQHSYYPVRSDDGEVIGISCVVEDVTIRNEALEALRQARDELDQRVQDRTAELQKVNQRLNQEIAQRARAEEELGERERYTRGIMTNIADAVVTIDARGDIQSFNPAAESMFGYTVADVLGKNVSILMPEPDHSKHDGYIQAYLETGKGKILGVGPREVTARHKDGSTFAMEITVGEMKLGDRPVFVGAMRDITERKRAEEKLRESEARLSAVVNNAPLAIVVKDTEGRYVMTNTQFIKYFGFSDEEAKGKTAHDLHPTELAEQLSSHEREVVKTLTVIEDEYEISTSEGLRHFSEVKFPVLDRSGVLVGIGAMVTDVTDRKQAEAALRDSEERFMALVNHAHTLVYVKDLEGRFQLINPAYEEWTGITAKDVHGKTVHDLFPEVASIIDAMERAVIETGKPAEQEYQVPYRDGTVRTMLTTKFPIFDASGVLSAIGSIGMDITERKRAEEALRESEERFRAVVENSPVGIYLKDTEGCFLLFNRYNEKLHGISLEEARGKTVYDLLPEDVAAAMAAHDAEVIKRDAVVESEIQVRSRDGSVRSIVATKFPVYAPDGAIIAIGGVDMDVTERERATEALRESEKQMRLITDNLPASIAYQDMEQRFVFANKVCATWYGRELAEIIGKRVEELFSEAAYRRLLPRIETVLSGEAVNFEESIEYPDGRVRSVEVAYIPDLGQNGQVKGFFGLVVDITERKRLEEQYSHAQKMEAVGQLTGGVAHDFNNLLTVILGNLELLDEQLGDNDELRSLAFAAQNAGLRGAELTRRLLAFSRKQPLEPKVIDLDRLVLGMSGLLRRTLGQTIEIQTVTNAGLWRTLADPAQLENALLNLAINARDAMPDGGKLTIETLNVGRADEQVAKRADLAPGDYVTLRVSDSGVGMSPEALAHAVEPFFTTKEVGEGSGLGLSMVYGFARQSGGDLVIDSAPDQGTRVTLYLPKADAKDEAEAAEEAELSAYPGGGETVLVVEDDADVRALAVKTLAGLGYEVIEADSGPAALELLEGEQKVDLLFSDVLMPGGMSGWMLAQQGLRIRPGLKVLLTSGYPRDAVADHDLPEQGVGLLPKPYAKAGLARKVRSVLDGDAAQFEDGRRLLVVDDDPDIGDFVRRVAEGEGYEVKVTARPEAFKAIYEAFRPAVIVMDIVMPEVDGIELLRYLAEQGCRSRVVVMSGFNESYLRHARSIGEGFGLAEVSGLVKPLRVEALRSALQSPA